MLIKVNPHFVFDTDESGGGTPEPVVIDWNAIDPTAIPAEIVKNTPAFKEVLNESIERRKKIRSLVEETKPKEASRTKTATAAQTEDTPSGEDDPLSVLRHELSEIKSVLTRQQEISLSQWKEQAIAQTGLPKEMADRIKGSSFSEILADAQALAKYMNITPPPSGSASNPTYQPDESRRELIRKKTLGEWNPTRPFDPGLQRQLGGGFTEL